MTKLPRVKGQELIAALRKAGFEVILKEAITFYVIPMDGVHLQITAPEHRRTQIEQPFTGDIQKDHIQNNHIPKNLCTIL